MNYLYGWQHYLFMWYYITELVDAFAPYKTIALEDPSVCSEITRRGVKFDFGTALNLTQSRLGDHSLRWSANVNCNFRLIPTTKHDGIIAVIQELSFRRNESTGECIDYVQFKTPKGRPSEKICGEVNAKQIMNMQPKSFDTQAKNTFINNHSGQLDVFVYISKTALQPDEDTKINIIFTLFHFCVQVPMDYEPCLDTREICIQKDYFYDGVINCPFFGCVDEGGCSEMILTNSSIGNKVLIGSATSLVFIFIIFIACLYICRKQRKFCWSDDFAGPDTTIQSQTTRVIEMNESPNQSTTTNITAPTTNNQEEDKDLPPSYDSLFPSR